MSWNSEIMGLGKAGFQYCCWEVLIVLQGVGRNTDLGVSYTLLHMLLSLSTPYLQGDLGKISESFPHLWGGDTMPWLVLLYRLNEPTEVEVPGTGPCSQELLTSPPRGLGSGSRSLPLEYRGLGNWMSICPVKGTVLGSCHVLYGI